MLYFCGMGLYSNKRVGSFAYCLWVRGVNTPSIHDETTNASRKLFRVKFGGL